MATLCYKLTDANMQTYANTQWRLGEWRESTGSSEKPLCTDAWIHVYDSPELAVLLNPIHANFTSPRLFEAECDGAMKDDNGLKRGFQRMRLVREITLPQFTVTQRVAFGILCAKQVYSDATFNEWASDWLQNKNREAAAAALAAEVVEVAEAAAEAARAAAAWAAAEAAAWAAWAAAEAAAWAARASARATARATAAAWTKIKIDLKQLALDALNY